MADKRMVVALHVVCYNKSAACSRSSGRVRWGTASKVRAGR